LITSSLGACGECSDASHPLTALCLSPTPLSRSRPLPTPSPCLSFAWQLRRKVSRRRSASCARPARSSNDDLHRCASMLRLLHAAQSLSAPDQNEEEEERERARASERERAHEQRERERGTDSCTEHSPSMPPSRPPSLRACLSPSLPACLLPSLTPSCPPDTPSFVAHERSQANLEWWSASLKAPGTPTVAVSVCVCVCSCARCPMVSRSKIARDAASCVELIRAFHSSSPTPDLCECLRRCKNEQTQTDTQRHRAKRLWSTQ